ncbi:MAG TPA: FTR1 family protein [Rubrobacteraceae bacterium]|nr:FTR1 family protein [Rubrobacteraceae bacterium]
MLHGANWRSVTNPWTIGLALAASLVIAVMVWQAVTEGGAPDPTAPDLSPTAAAMNSGILVFREGLEAVLVLAAITAGLVRSSKSYWRPIATGSGVAFLATIVTWFVVVAIISAIDAPALDVQAATGLLAILVLLVIMNWFFHKVYWTGWIGLHNRRRQRVLERSGGVASGAFFGLALLGFSAIYREGFEIVLFLQSLRLEVGSFPILQGAAIGLFLSSIVAVLTFVAHRRIPYKKMLIVTGVLLGVVLVVMVGEEVQEMQLAGWLPTTEVGVSLPEWLGVWFAVFPNVEGLVAQALAALFVAGSYLVVERNKRSHRQASQTSNV